jgi:hypothetical protein
MSPMRKSHQIETTLLCKQLCQFTFDRVELGIFIRRALPVPRITTNVCFASGHPKHPRP